MGVFAHVRGGGETLSQLVFKLFCVNGCTLMGLQGSLILVLERSIVPRFSARLNWTTQRSSRTGSSGAGVVEGSAILTFKELVLVASIAVCQ